jgi:hypothetical protein
MTQENWRTSGILPAYEISDQGRVRRIPYKASMHRGGERTYGGHAWSGSLDSTGRPKIFYKGKNYRVSRLVCDAFHGPAPSAQSVVMHFDDNTQNNTAGNLEWGTQKENMNTPSYIAYCKSRTGDSNPYVKSKLKKVTATGCKP